MRIAYQGAPGAFSHEACRAFAPALEAVPQASFADVVEAVLTGIAERGILPMSNNAAGVVPGNSELLDDARLDIVSSHALTVRLHLLALPGVQLANLRTVTSHPMALKQCARGLAALGLATEEATNTAVAAATLKERDKAVLASQAAADAYGLDIVRSDIQDHADNATTFSLFKLRKAT